MRTTVDLPPAVHRRAVELARAKGESLSRVLADLTTRGLAQLDDSEASIRTDTVSGLPVISIGQRVTSADVARILDDE